MLCESSAERKEVESMNDNQLLGKTRSLWRGLGLVAAGATLTAGVTLAASNNVLYMNGQVASTDVRTINGSAYVRVADVAKALDMSVVRRGDGSLEISKAGGANQVGGLQGKVGDTLFDGKWRMTVNSVSVAPRYVMKYAPAGGKTGIPITYDINDHSVTPNSGYQLVIVNCRVSNGQRSSQNFWLNDYESTTALTDSEGESYEPMGYDVEGAPTQTKSMLPGSKVDIPVIFAVPNGKHITGFVFNLRNGDGRKGSNARVTLDVHSD